MAFLFWDKANHFLVYTLGGWLAASALGVSRPAARIAGTVILAVVGALISLLTRNRLERLVRR